MKQIAPALQEPQFQKPRREKTIGIKILQWTELIIFLSYVLLFIQYPVAEGVFLLLYITLSAPLLIFSLGFFIYDKGFLKFNLIFSYFTIPISLVLVLFSAYLFFSVTPNADSFSYGFGIFIAFVIGLASITMLILSLISNRYITKILKA